MVRTVPFLHCHPLPIATMEHRGKDWMECYNCRLPKGEPEPRAKRSPKTPTEGALKTWAGGVPPSARGISLLASFVRLSFFCQLYIWLSPCLAKKGC